VGTPYTPAFYGRHRDGSASSARAILPRVAEWVAPRSVVDVGCGLGTWLAAWSELGVADLVGVEGGHVPEDGLAVPCERVLVRDLERPFDLGRSFDLAMSLEVAEHLRPASAEGFVPSLAALAPVAGRTCGGPIPRARRSGRRSGSSAGGSRTRWCDAAPARPRRGRAARCDRVGGSRV
jgi:hypothetical protein